jgi:hypothetical protein
MINQTKRRMLGIISIVPAAAILLLWIHSYSTDWHLRSDGGRLYFFCVEGGDHPNSWYGAASYHNASLVWTYLKREPSRNELKTITLLGVQCIASGGKSSPNFKAFSIPFLHLFILSLAPVCLFLRYRRTLSIPGAQPCPVCNYDLRATPERCPECGATPAKLATQG